LPWTRIINLVWASAGRYTGREKRRTIASDNRKGLHVLLAENTPPKTADQVPEMTLLLRIDWWKRPEIPQDAETSMLDRA
jgi:hypothetical protein